MVVILKILGLVLIGIGVIILLAGMSAASDALGLIILLLMGGLPAALGIFCLSKSKKKQDPAGANVPDQPTVPSMPVPESLPNIEPVQNPEPEPATDDPSAPEPEKDSFKKYSFKVAGISRRQRAITDNLIPENYEYSLSKKELVDLGMIGERIYKYDPTVMDADLVPEPNNPKDPNAIKVLVNNVQIGYVPAEKTSVVKKLLSSKQVHSIACGFYGGPFKIITEDYDDENDKEVYNTEKESHYIGAEVILKYM